MGNGGEAGSLGWGIGMGGRAFGRVFLSRMAGLWQLYGRHPCRIQTRQDILVLTPLGFRAFC